MTQNTSTEFEWADHEGDYTALDAAHYDYDG
jgi:hypothetical protein